MPCRVYLERLDAIKVCVISAPPHSSFSLALIFLPHLQPPSLPPTAQLAQLPLPASYQELEQVALCNNLETLPVSCLYKKAAMNLIRKLLHISVIHFF